MPPASGLSVSVFYRSHGSFIDRNSSFARESESFVMQTLSEIWFALPLIIAISLVYAGTRHEAMPVILMHAARVAGWISGFMALIWIVLLIVSWWL
jgi:hypothetical protein